MSLCIASESLLLIGCKRLTAASTVAALRRRCSDDSSSKKPTPAAAPPAPPRVKRKNPLGAVRAAQEDLEEQVSRAKAERPRDWVGNEEMTCSLPQEGALPSDPILVDGYGANRRIIACQCARSGRNPIFMWLYEGPPKRCECGKWFQLVHRTAPHTDDDT